MGAISLRRKSTTALISSSGVGSSCMLVSSRRQQPQQIDLGFRGAAADHRALDGMLRPNAKPLHHAAAHHAPAQRAHHFPEFYSLGIDVAARCLISGKQLFARAKAADRLVDLPKTPRIDADPPE